MTQIPFKKVMLKIFTGGRCDFKQNIVRYFSQQNSLYDQLRSSNFKGGRCDFDRESRRFLNDTSLLYNQLRVDQYYRWKMLLYKRNQEMSLTT